MLEMLLCEKKTAVNHFSFSQFLLSLASIPAMAHFLTLAMIVCANVDDGVKNYELAHGIYDIS